jgi:signal transduction histidine kinase
MQQNTSEVLTSQHKKEKGPRKKLPRNKMYVGKESEKLHLRQRIISDEKSQHYMATISDSAKHMNILIDDLLSFSRMGRNEISKPQVDIDELVQGIIREFRPESEGRDIQ